MAVKHENSVTHLMCKRRNVWSGGLFGLGLIAFVDEVVFHQLLHWHHFYDKSTTDIGLISDGLFHAFSWFATVGASFMLADLHRRDAWRPALWWGGALLGAGIFQLYDGTIQHKLMRIHQIRYDVTIWPYDLTWNVIAAAMIIAGAMLVVRARRQDVRREGESYEPPSR
ncbi:MULTISPECIES: DUF2243 domain-containing protein [Geobacillus]|uniref:DUF2243 domain-containing protein n=1 Tax=Geobacillus TaxID=129337 RepID=UPI0009BF8C6D|nr:DUF2243 domain-containing protein [Geobacillus sp. 46C-IIa]OQP07717.1 hypothetical protein B1690_00035 [Geobacillus sp. 46C-IIa]QNU27125.1 DUF2243 domain-containing protein [Geobacillus sp. 46C-IIa]